MYSQSHIQRQKRQAHAARLKEQAEKKNSVKAAEKPSSASSDSVDSDSDEELPADSKPRKTPLPAFLPADLLAAPAPPPTLTPHKSRLPSPSKSKPSTHTKFTDPDRSSKLPKPIKKGDVTVRVLESTNKGGTTLAPKRDKKTAAVKDRMKTKGVERKVIGGGFVKR